MGGFGIEISPPEAYFLFLRRCRPPKSHPLKPISCFCGVFWPPNLTPNHLITLMYLFYIPIPFFAKGIVFGISAALSILPYTSFSKTNPPSHFWLSPQTQLPSILNLLFLLLPLPPALPRCHTSALQKPTHLPKPFQLHTHICYFCCPAAPTHQLFKCPHLPSYLKKVISGSCCACLKTLTPL